jgi:hypothetical protein
MSSSKLNDWVQVIGLFAVVGSLIFVGLQVKQAKDIALASQYQARTATTEAMWLTSLESVRDPDLLRKPLTQMTSTERAMAVYMVNWDWTHYDNHFFQYTSGFLDDEAWVGLSRRIQSLYDNCDLRGIWAGNRQYYRPSFVRYVESLDDACKTPASKKD